MSAESALVIEGSQNRLNQSPPNEQTDEDDDDNDDEGSTFL